MNKTSLSGLRALVAVTALVSFVAPAAYAQEAAPGWLAKDADWAKTKTKLQTFGDQFTSSEALYAALKKAAKGGKSPTWQQLSLPGYDWSGIYTRGTGGLQFDPDLPFMMAGPKSPEPPKTTARLTAAAAADYKAKAEALFRTGGEYDPLSSCRPPGTPRWFTEPFLKEYVVTPNQTWLINEMVNDIRRVYTDGRDHTSEADAYGTPNGDTIGFWNGDVLVTHTKYLMEGQYQRGVQPNFSDQTSIVERWRKVNPKTLEVDVWVFDPVNLVKPWYTRQTYSKLTNDDYNLRIRYWDCGENPNNAIIKKDDGTSQFGDFNFVGDDAAVSKDPAVKKATEQKSATPAK